MISRSIRAAAFVVVALLSAQTLATDFFRVDFEVKVNGERIANPTITTKERSPTKMTLSGPNGEGYELSLLIESMPSDQIKLAVDFQSEKFGNASPVLITRSGQPAIFSTGKLPDKLLEIKIVASPN
ncbi:MAG: hypothetical protein EAZ21_08075 [Betaproteobacteria bacterium]|nr:MAG: hypothetical protein EAZ21_08075 [Betaproteobacteria bacterium]